MKNIFDAIKKARSNKTIEENFSQQVRTPIISQHGRIKSKIKIKKWIKVLVLGLAVLFICMVLLIKFDMNEVAILTDSVLRPVVGDSNVIWLEKIFFNASDKFKQITFNPNSVTAPQFEGDASNSGKSNLDLTPLRINNNFKSLAGEGIWQNHPLSLFPTQEVMAVTFVRSDPQRPYSITTLVQMDMSQMKLGSVAGTQQPGGPVGKPGPGVVPNNIIDSGKLIAAFDGGFQYKDGAYGMIVNNTTYLPLKNDLGTLVGYKDGTLKIFDYQGQSLGNNIDFIRQNCPILINNGEITTTNQRDKKLWGRLAAGTVDIYTWRSGIGLTAKGNLIFAVGNNLTPATLAAALKSAGAVNAIQLDINPIWVRFNIFEPNGFGKYISSTLTKDLQDGSKQYLNGYQKDFFYVYKK